MRQTVDPGATRELTTGRLRGPVAGPLELTVTSASYGARGAGAAIHYALAPTPFGRVLLAATSHGVCWIGIHDSATYLESELRADYARAEVTRDDARTAPLAARVIAAIVGEAAELDLPMDIRATPFQLAVWRELCAIPRGATRAYGEIARRLGRPDASRAVGHANGSNPTAIVVPCHRVIGRDGTLTGYRWGMEYKRRLLEHEGVLVQTSMGDARRRALT
jgi:AraC family transcriptional regulator, regulatory protein of adaptative response / methylated-DNA-[protein]-cysteine methyltransferase